MMIIAPKGHYNEEAEGCMGSQLISIQGLIKMNLFDMETLRHVPCQYFAILLNNWICVGMEHPDDLP